MSQRLISGCDTRKPKLQQRKKAGIKQKKRSTLSAGRPTERHNPRPHPPGRLPLGALRLPRSPSDAAAASLLAGGAAGADGSGGGAGALAAERALQRHFSSPCEPPNAAVAAVPGAAGGCSCVAYSRDGRWLAAALASADGDAKASWGGERL
jgi:hypothetical protein